MFFYDSFEAAWTNSVTTPAGWSKSNVVGTTNWAQRTNPLTGQSPPTGNLARLGSAVAMFAANDTAGSTTRLESPTFNLSSATNPAARLYYVNTSGADVLRVRVSTDGGTTWVTLATLTTTPNNNWQLQTVSLASVAGLSQVKIGLEAVADNGTSDIWVDDLLVSQ